MKTVVYQSYRTSNVPAWVSRSMQAVRDWAASQGYDYRFLDDEFLGYAPDWYRRKVSDNILLVTDLARLLVAKQFLREGYERTIWIDADLVIFCPASFRIDVTEGYCFCREFWIAPTKAGQLTGSLCINNAVSVFVEPNHFLDFYIDACQAIVQHHAQPDKLAVGTRFLSGLYQVLPFRLINEVGGFSPYVMKRLLEDGADATLPFYRQASGFPVYAANLCSSYRNTSCHGIMMDDTVYARVIDKLLGAPQTAAEPEA